MRKIISSSFILMLLLISLWGFSSWSFGENNKKDIEKLLSSKKTVFSDNFEYEVLETSYSLFGVNAKVGIDLSSFSVLSAMDFEAEQTLIFNIELYNGPLLLDKSGINTGRSIWHISLDDKLNNKQWIRDYNLGDLPTVIVYVDFENQIKYKINHQSNDSQISLVGEYNSKDSTGFGEVIVKNYIYTVNQNTIKFDDATITYKHSSNDVTMNKLKLNININSPKASYQHQLMSIPYSFKLKGFGLLSIVNKVINNKSEFFLEPLESNIYPIDQTKIDLDIKQLKLEEFYLLSDSYASLNDLKNQSEWVLAEQTETPEGQDKLWQLNDESQMLKTSFPDMSKALLVTNENPNIQFSINSTYQDKPSILTGSVLPQSDKAFLEDSYNSEDNQIITSFWSLFKVQAKVNLGKPLLDYIAKQLPINKSNFELRYEHNKLLMQ